MKPASEQPELSEAVRGLSLPAKSLPAVDGVARLQEALQALAQQLTDSESRLSCKLDILGEQLGLDAAAMNRKVNGLDGKRFASEEELERKVHGPDRKMVDGLRRKFDALDPIAITMELNTAARAQNGKVVRGEMELASLHSLRTGKVISGFPKTLSQFEKLPSGGAKVDDLLRELVGEPAVDIAAQKKQTLRLALGLPMAIK